MRDYFAAQLFGVVLIVALLSACAGGSSVVTLDEGAIEPGKTVSLRVKKGQNVSHEQFVEMSRRFQHVLSLRLEAEGIFASVLPPGDQADYKMVVSIDRYRPGSYGALGKRRGVVEARISIIEGTTDRQIKLFRSTGVGAHLPFAPGQWGIDAPLAEALEQIVVTLGGKPQPSS